MVQLFGIHDCNDQSPPVLDRLSMNADPLVKLCSWTITKLAILQCRQVHNHLNSAARHQRILRLNTLAD